MRTRKISTLVAASAIALALTGVPAAAETGQAGDGDTSGTGDTQTDVQLTIETGALEVTAPDDSTGAIDLGTVSTADLLGGSYTTPTTGAGSFGQIQVVDNRGALIANWTATAWGTDLSTGSGTEPETIEGADVVYTAVSTSVLTGSGLATPAAGTLDSQSAQVVYAGAGGVNISGVNEVTWQPQLTFTFDENLVAGTYTGTIYHDVT